MRKIISWVGRYVVVAGMIAGLGACQTVHTTAGGTVEINRSQSMLVSAETMNKAAQKNYAEVIDDAKQKKLLNQQPKTVKRVKQIAQRLIVQTPVFREDAKNWAWEVNLITSDDVNAWCMPGGKIAVYTALIDQLKLTDDELAAVMGHEMAHALREHAREDASHQAVASVIISLGSALLGLGDAGREGGSYAYMGLMGLPNSREHETEADRIGVELAARAGYNPKAAISLWQKMAKLSNGNEPLVLLSTHPSNDTRMKDLADYAERVYPLYLKTKNS